MKADNHTTTAGADAAAHSNFSERQGGGQPLLSRTECNVLRGLAIMGIVLHNFSHWLGMAVKENEYKYTQGNVDDLLRVLSHPDWNLPVHLLSFFGHYGVPVFLFLSAYGLVLKYENQAPAASFRGENATANASPLGNMLHFVKHHFLKLFKMMIVGFVLFIIVDALTPGRHQYRLMDIVAQLGMFNNLLPQPNHIIWPGPYWFFGLMLQLYVVYRVLLYKRHWAWTVALVAVCTVVQMFFPPESEQLNRLRYNFVGSVLPFGMGLLCARYAVFRASKALHWANLLVSLCVIFAASCSYFSWYFVPIFICLFSVSLVKLLPSSWLRPLDWLGGVSAALFIVHPAMRKIFIPVSRQGDTYAGLLLYVIAAIAVAWLVREVMGKMEKQKRSPKQ